MKIIALICSNNVTSTTTELVAMNHYRLDILGSVVYSTKYL